MVPRERLLIVLGLAVTQGKIAEIANALKQDTIALERDSRSARGQAAAGNGINRRLADLVT
jgi:hypothetical protein